MKYNFEEPKSATHARAEMESKRESINEALNRKKMGKQVDDRQLQIDQLRMCYLRKWLKAYNHGGKPDCQGCEVLNRLYQDCKNILPESWRQSIWDLTHKSARMEPTIKRRENDADDKIAHIDIFWKRMRESAIPAWQKEQNKPGVYPDLGELISWIIGKANGMKK